MGADTAILDPSPAFSEATASAPTGSPAHRRPLGPALAGVAALASAATFPLVALVRAILVRGAAGPTSGAIAALAHQAVRASHFGADLGLPSRFGAHAPGPALAYLVAPAVRLIPSSPLTGLSVGVLAVDGLALVGTVAALWRRFGPGVALWTAGLIDLWLLGIGLGVVRNPQPGFAVLGPMVAFVVLWALGATGTTGAWLWAAAAGSVVAETHLAAAPFVVAMLLVGGVAGLVSASGQDRLEVPWRWWRSPARTTGWVALVIVWLPSILELFRDRHTNLAALWDFGRHGHPATGLADGLRATVAAITIAPLGVGPAHAVDLFRRDTLATVLGGGVLAVVAVAVATVAARRRSSVARALVGAAVVGTALGLASFALAPEHLQAATVAFLAYVPLALGVALGVAVIGPLGPATASPPGIRGLLKKAKKAAEKRASRHRPPPLPRAPQEGDKPPSKAAGSAGKAAKKAKAKAKAAAAGGAVASRRGAFEWGPLPQRVLVPLAALALLVAGVVAGEAAGLPALHVATVAVRPLAGTHH